MLVEKYKGLKVNSVKKLIQDQLVETVSGKEFLFRFIS